MNAWQTVVEKYRHGKMRMHGQIVSRLRCSGGAGRFVEHPRADREPSASLCYYSDKPVPCAMGKVQKGAYTSRLRVLDMWSHDFWCCPQG